MCVSMGVLGQQTNIAVSGRMSEQSGHPAGYPMEPPRQNLQPVEHAERLADTAEIRANRHTGCRSPDHENRESLGFLDPGDVLKNSCSYVQGGAEVPRSVTREPGERSQALPGARERWSEGDPRRRAECPELLQRPSRGAACSTHSNARWAPWAPARPRDRRGTAEWLTGQGVPLSRRCGGGRRCRRLLSRIGRDDG